MSSEVGVSCAEEELPGRVPTLVPEFFGGVSRTKDFDVCFGGIGREAHVGRASFVTVEHEEIGGVR